MKLSIKTIKLSDIFRLYPNARIVGNGVSTNTSTQNQSKTQSKHTEQNRANAVDSQLSSG